LIVARTRLSAHLPGLGLLSLGDLEVMLEAAENFLIDNVAVVPFNVVHKLLLGVCDHLADFALVGTNRGKDLFFVLLDDCRRFIK
jgi:hypothetical protein